VRFDNPFSGLNLLSHPVGPLGRAEVVRSVQDSEGFLGMAELAEDDSVFEEGANVGRGFPGPGFEDLEERFLEQHGAGPGGSREDLRRPG
jgi:hypothetical protein